MPKKTLKQSQKYIPGVCNIGPAERRKRRIAGLFGLLVTVVAAILLVVSDVDWVWRLLLIIPATGSATGLLQDAMHFCVGFGMKGVFNVLHSAGKTDSVSQAEYRRKDRGKARLILGYSVLIGALFTGIVILI